MDIKKYISLSDNDLETLECDHCGEFISYCWALDLNGSYFFCKKCIEKNV